MLDLSPIQTMLNLKQLWIHGSQSEDNTFLFNKTSSIDSLGISHLHISLRLYHFPRIKIFLTLLKNLEVLDIQNALHLNKIIPIQDMFQCLRSSPVSAISLPRFQTLRYGYEPHLDLTAIIPAEYNISLTYLDLSTNYILSITGNLLQFANLAIVDLSQNFLNSLQTNGITNNTLGTFILFHPSVQVFDIGRQDHYFSSRNIINDEASPLSRETQDRMARTKRANTQTFFSSNNFFGTRSPKIELCLTHVTSNLNSIISNHTLFVLFINCVLNTTYQIPSQNIPPLASLINTNCSNSFQFPIAPNLHDLRMDNIFNDNMILTSTETEKPICIYKNSIYSLKLSYNKISNTAFKDIFDSLDGLYSLTNLELNGIGSILLTNEIFMNYRNVSRLRIGDNEIMISKDFTICHQLPKLSYLDVSNSNISHLPKDTFKDCIYINTIDLSNNMISFLHENIRDTLDTIAEKQELYVDLSSNLLSCGCHGESQNTIKWIHTSKIRFMSHFSYKCVGHHGMEFIIDKNLNEYAELCEINDNTVKVIIISLTSSFSFYVTIILLFMMYRFRFRIRTKLHRMSLFIRKTKRSNHQSLHPSLHYDIYLSNYEKDFNTVRLVMLMANAFENTHGLKCCVPDRDFPADGIMHDTITDHMSDSRVIVMLINNTSLQNPIFHFEHLIANSFKTTLLNPPPVVYILMADMNTTAEIIQNIVDCNTHYVWPTFRDCETLNFSEREIIDRIVLKVMKTMHRPHDVISNEIEMTIN